MSEEILHLNETSLTAILIEDMGDRVRVRWNDTGHEEVLEKLYFVEYQNEHRQE